MIENFFQGMSGGGGGGMGAGGGVTGKEAAGAGIGLLLGSLLGRTDKQLNQQQALQSATENLYSQFTNKRGKDVPLFADYRKPMQGMAWGIAQAQKLGSGQQDKLSVTREFLDSEPGYSSWVHGPPAPGTTLNPYGG